MTSFRRYFRLIFVMLLIPGFILFGSLIIGRYTATDQREQYLTHETMRTLTPRVLHQLEEDLITFSLFAQSTHVQTLFHMTPQNANQRVIELGLLDSSIVRLYVLDANQQLQFTVPEQDPAIRSEQAMVIGPYHLHEIVQPNAHEILLAEKVLDMERRTLGYIIATMSLDNVLSRFLLEVPTLRGLTVYFDGVPGVTHQGATCTVGDIRFFGRGYHPTLCGESTDNFWSIISAQELILLPVVIFIFSIGLALLLAWRIARSLQTPIHELSELVRCHQCADTEQYHATLRRLDERQDEFGQLARTVDVSRRTIATLQSEKNRLETTAAVGNMASQVAHDLRSPLSSMQVAVRGLGRESSDPESESAKYLMLLQMSAKRLGILPMICLIGRARMRSLPRFFHCMQYWMNC